jgi:hypothetical protein
MKQVKLLSLPISFPTAGFAIKSSLAVSMVFMLGVMSPTASALVTSTTVSGCTLYKKSLGQCSVFVDAILKGLGNVRTNPTAFAATMFKISGQVFCVNPAGNSSEANGQPFTDLPVELSAGDAVTQDEITKNGKSLSDVAFHDADILKALADNDVALPDCQSQWNKTIIVTKMEILGRQLEDPTPSNPATCYLSPNTGEDFLVDGCTTVDSLRVSCRIQAPYFDSPVLAIGKTYTYGDKDTGSGACTEICHSTDANLCSTTAPQ